MYIIKKKKGGISLKNIFGKKTFKSEIPPYLKKKFWKNYIKIRKKTTKMFFVIFIDMGRNETKCLCIICNETDDTLFYKGRKNKCKSCMSTEYKNREDKQEYMEKQKKWRSKNILHYRVESAKHRAKRCGMVFEINDNIIQEKINSQGGVCFISKQPLSYFENDWNSLSLDRLDSSLGYTVENTIVVTKFVNNSKNNLSLDEYLELIKFVCENIK